MDVTKKNYAEVIPQIETHIAECDFISFDLEFTGLFTQITNDYLDTHEQFYSKCRKNIHEFQIIQIGLSFFKKITEREFDCNSYNFYIFPNRCHLMSRQKKERYFLSQASSLSFLVDNGFDFNKLIKEGISYLNLSEEKYVTEKFNESPEPVQVNLEADKTFIEGIMKDVVEFVNDKEKSVLVLPQANPFRRKLIYEAVQNSEYNDELDLSVNANDKQRIDIKRCSSAEKRERNRVALLEMVGFTHIIKCIIQNPKPLVGHNMYLDLLYIYNTFIGELPEDYAEFKKLFHCLFPQVFDTRHISSEGILGNLIPNNCLGNLYKSLLDHPFMQTSINLKNSTKSYERLHEAGYDSFITGCCFINLIRYLYAQEFVNVEDMFSNHILQAYNNKIILGKSYDLKYMDLAEDDVLPSRAHVFHMTFPKDWKTNSIYALFGDFGGLANVTYIDDTSAFCILKEPTNACKVIEKLFHQPRTPYRLQLFADFLARTKKASNEKRIFKNIAQNESEISPQHKKAKKRQPN